MSITELISLAKISGYHDENKAKYKKESRKFLNSIVKELNLRKGEYDLRFNPGGVAGSGDAVLHANNFYVYINDFGHYWRLVEGRKDYTGKSNRRFSGTTVKEIATEIKNVLENGPNY